MYSNENEYISTSLDSDIFLSEIPLLLLKESIQAQFTDPLESQIDYVTTFIDKYQHSKDMCDEEQLPYLYALRDDFMGFMLVMFKHNLGVGIPDFDDISESDQNDIVMIIYQFFIRNIKKNFSHLILNYIDKYRKSLSEISGKKKDVTTLSFKKEITNVEDLNIIANLSDIIDFILSVEMDVSEFLTLTKQCLETKLIDEAYDEFKVTGNFVDKYKSMIDRDFKRDIEVKVRNKILKKYKKNEYYQK